MQRVMRNIFKTVTKNGFHNNVCFLIIVFSRFWDFLFDNYSPANDQTKVLSKERERADRGFWRKIWTLNLSLPKLDGWQDFRTNGRNKAQIWNLLADYFTSDEIAHQLWERRFIYHKRRLSFMKPIGGERQEVEELHFTHREAEHRYTSSE